MTTATGVPGALTPYNGFLGERLKDFIRYSEVKQVLYRILDLQKERGTDFRSLAVVSALPGEGKTLFCTALAMAYVETCRARLLVVDTTTFNRPGSLILRQCLDPSHPQIDLLSLAEERRSANGVKPLSGVERQEGPLGTDEREGLPPPSPMEIEHSLIRKVAKEHAKQYGLVILDTTALSVKNKNNLDPSLVARKSDASLLLVSRKLLESSDLGERLQQLMDPALHLIGVVSNEAAPQ